VADLDGTVFKNFIHFVKSIESLEVKSKGEGSILLQERKMMPVSLPKALIP